MEGGWEPEVSPCLPTRDPVGHCCESLVDFRRTEVEDRTDFLFQDLTASLNCILSGFTGEDREAVRHTVKKQHSQN